MKIFFWIVARRNISMFVNDIEMYLSENNESSSISLDQITIYLLLFSESAAGLQTSLNNLQVYCEKWNLKVNVTKTKVVIYKKGVIMS